MSGNHKIIRYANEFVENQAETTYEFRTHGYSGVVEVMEWDPVVSEGMVHNTEIAHNMDDWLRGVAEMNGVQMTDEEVWELAEAIEARLPG